MPFYFAFIFLINVCLATLVSHRYETLGYIFNIFLKELFNANLLGWV